MIVLRRCQVCRGFAGDGIAIGAESVESVADVCRGPQHGGVGDQGETECSVDLVIEMPASDVALASEDRSRRRACRLSPLFS